MTNEEYLKRFDKYDTVTNDNIIPVVNIAMGIIKDLITELKKKIEKRPGKNKLHIYNYNQKFMNINAMITEKFGRPVLINDAFMNLFKDQKHG